MPPQRRVLGSISPNIISRRQLTQYERGQIIGAHQAGLTDTQIAKQFNTPRSTIQDTIKYASNRPTGVVKIRSGRPKITTKRDERFLLRYIRKYPKATYKQLRRDTGLNYSDRVLRRIMKDHGILHWRAKKRPKLDAKDATIRLHWAQNHRHWTEADWAKVRFSDECSVELGAGKGAEWAHGTHGQKYDRDKIRDRVRGKGLRIMIWAAIWGTGKSDIYPLSRDFESKKHGYSARSYIKVLEDNIGGIWGPGAIFQQDNARIYKAKATMEWFN
jgi:transposase